jgi:hypothetical protein
MNREAGDTLRDTGGDGRTTVLTQLLEAEQAVKDGTATDEQRAAVESSRESMRELSASLTRTLGFDGRQLSKQACKVDLAPLRRRLYSERRRARAQCRWQSPARQRERRGSHPGRYQGSRRSPSSPTRAGPSDDPGGEPPDDADVVLRAQPPAGGLGLLSYARAGR